MLDDSDTPPVFRPLAFPGQKRDGANETTPAVIADDELLSALGISAGEGLRVERVAPQRTRIRDRIEDRLFETVTLTLRVQPPAEATRGRKAVMLDPASLDVLGIDSGSEVVLRGARPVTDGSADGAEWRLVTERVKAYATTGELAAERAALAGGSWGAAIPTDTDALGLPPQRSLGTIYLDDSMAHRLGAAEAMATVQVRPSRSYAVIDNFREVALAWAIAFTGIAVGFWQVAVTRSYNRYPPGRESYELVWTDLYAVLGCVAMAVAMTGAAILIIWRIRSKLR